ncbi:hypothetical protein [Vibrio cincinnatiensis]|uniref:hypothetical protein n=1 Tax=Vibrio cincinnatiensis TaxID=675 RepID=UPI001FAAD9E0|nr:hypothetical protein [Vibrio cincinnatiensis]
MFSYIFKGKTYTDTTREFMLNIGMNTEQIDSVLSQQEYESKQNVELRQQAYKRESDPLYIEWQFELESENPEADKYKQAWMDKVSEIKVRFPIPQ